MKIMTKKINLKITIEETAERHPVSVLGTDYKVKIIYKNIKISIMVLTRSIPFVIINTYPMNTKRVIWGKEFKYLGH